VIGFGGPSSPTKFWEEKVEKVALSIETSRVVVAWLFLLKRYFGLGKRKSSHQKDR
jgi:hypothetical protein